MNLDAAQDGPYLLADSEHAVSFMKAHYFKIGEHALTKFVTANKRCL